MNPQPPGSDERLLLQDCLAGNPHAWRTLFDRYRRALAFVVARRLRASPRQAAWVEEVLADLWFALWQNNCRRLRVYDPNRSSLMTYLALLASQQAGRFIEQRVRRQQRQVSLTARRAAQLVITSSPLLLRELWETLWANVTPRERQRLHDLLRPATAEELSQQPSSPSDRKAKQRVRERLRQLLDENGAA